MSSRLDDVHLDVVRTANGALRASVTSPVDTRAFLCECGESDCARTVVLTAAVYDGLRLEQDRRVLHDECADRERAAPSLGRGLSAWRRLLRRDAGRPPGV